MIRRCYEKSHPSFKNYGLKGVKVCNEWLNDYQNFLTWSLENGYMPGLQIDKDKYGNGMLYSPENCCWITRKENVGYKKSSVKFIVNGIEMNLNDVSKKVGLDRRLISIRISRGWSREKSISTPALKSLFVNFGAFKNGLLIHKFKNLDEAVHLLGGDRKRYWRALTGRTTASTKTEFNFKYL